MVHQKLPDQNTPEPVALEMLQAFVAEAETKGEMDNTVYLAKKLINSAK